MTCADGSLIHAVVVLIAEGGRSVTALLILLCLLTPVKQKPLTKSLLCLIDGCASPSQTAKNSTQIQPYLIVGSTISNPNQIFLAAEGQLLCEVAEGFISLYCF
jgi:hypothetical protein